METIKLEPSQRALMAAREHTRTKGEQRDQTGLTTAQLGEKYDIHRAEVAKAKRVLAYATEWEIGQIESGVRSLAWGIKVVADRAPKGPPQKPRSSGPREYTVLREALDALAGLPDPIDVAKLTATVAKRGKYPLATKVHSIRMWMAVLDHYLQTGGGL